MISLMPERKTVSLSYSRYSVRFGVSLTKSSNSSTSNTLYDFDNGSLICEQESSRYVLLIFEFAHPSLLGNCCRNILLGFGELFHIGIRKMEMLIETLDRLIR